MRDLKELTGYDIITEEKIPEVNGTGYILSHKKTKARVLVIANDDENKVFNIGFRTPPYDDSGIPHILLYSNEMSPEAALLPNTSDIPVCSLLQRSRSLVRQIRQ